jgi:hypothetical protein
MGVETISSPTGDGADEGKNLEHERTPVLVWVEFKINGLRDASREAPTDTRLSQVLTAQNVARKERFPASIHAGPFRRIEAALKAEVYGRKNRESQ